MARYPVRKAVAPCLISYENAPLLVEEDVAVKRSVRSEASALERVAISHPARIQRIATADQHDTSERRGPTSKLLCEWSEAAIRPWWTS